MGRRFFPDTMNEKDVISAIGEAYLKSRCKPFGDWNASIVLPGAGTTATVGEFVMPKGNVHYITSAYPMMQKQGA